MKKLLKFKTKKLHWLDLVFFLLIIFLIFYLYSNVQDTLVYNWRWKDLWVYFFRWDAEKSRYFLNTLSLGLINTIKLTVWSLVFALLFGFILAIMKNSKKKAVSWLAKSYIEFTRNIPSIVFLFLFYFFLSSQIFPFLGLEYLVYNLSETQKFWVEFFFFPTNLLENFLSGFISLSLLESAYIGEIIWAGIRSIHKGQWESAYSLGLRRFRILKQIIIPQAVYKVSPALTGQYINLIKDSSILSIISIQEISFTANNVIATSNLRFEVWLIVALIYLIICFNLSLLSKKLEKKVKLL